MSKFKRINLNVRQDTLDRLLYEYISGYAPSRASSAAAVSVSTVTSGKVADALMHCGFMDGRVFSVGESRPATRLLFNDRSSVLIIDLSTSVYKMCVVNPQGRTLLSLSHQFDPEISFEDNLYIFISRNGLKLKSSRIDFSAIAVLYANVSRKEGTYTSERAISTPSIAIKEYISDVICTILGREAKSHLTVSEAIGEAVKFKVIDLETIGRGISSIFIGSSIFSFHVYENGSVTVCSPENLLSREELSDLEHIRSLPKEKADALFVRIADFMDSAFSPSLLLLSSDILFPDNETGDRIYRRFTLTGRATPTIYTREGHFPLEYLGIARFTLLKVIKSYITTGTK